MKTEKLYLTLTNLTSNQNPAPNPLLLIRKSDISKYRGLQEFQLEETDFLNGLGFRFDFFSRSAH